MIDSITWNRLISTFLSPQNQGLPQVWNTCSWKRTIQKYERKDKFLRKYLGSVIGTVTFKKQSVDEIITQLISEIKVLSQIAKKELQAGYCCFTTAVVPSTKTKFLTLCEENLTEMKNWKDKMTWLIAKNLLSFTENKLCGSDAGLLPSLPSKVGRIGIPFLFFLFLFSRNWKENFKTRND